MVREDRVQFKLLNTSCSDTAHAWLTDKIYSRYYAVSVQVMNYEYIVSINCLRWWLSDVWLIPSGWLHLDIMRNSDSISIVSRGWCKRGASRICFYFMRDSRKYLSSHDHRTKYMVSNNAFIHLSCQNHRFEIVRTKILFCLQLHYSV